MVQSASVFLLVSVSSAQVLGCKTRGKNLRITLTHLSRLTTVIIRTLRVCKNF